MTFPVRTALEVMRLGQCSTTLFSLFRSLAAEGVIGVASAQLDRRVGAFLSSHGMTSALLGYRGFPSHCAISPNAVAVHGLPDQRPIARGDIFTLDIAAGCAGWTTDSAWTYVTPGVAARTRRLWIQSWQAFRELLCVVRPGISLDLLARRAREGAEQRDLKIFPQFVGHGIGRELHELPVIPFCPVDQGPALAQTFLQPGMTINIEPVYGFGETAVDAHENGWAFRTVDGMPTAHFELTLLVTDDGATVLQFGGIAPLELPLEPPFGEVES